MSRPRKDRKELHSVRLDLWLKEGQLAEIEALAAERDIPKGILARKALLFGMRAYVESLKVGKAA